MLTLTHSVRSVSTDRRGFGIVSLSCDWAPLTHSGVLDQAVSQPLAAAA